MAIYTRNVDRSTVSWTPGEIGNPTAEEAFKASNLSLSNETAVIVENGNVIGGHQTEAPIPGGRSTNISFVSEFRGSAVADVPPPEASIMRACAFRETASGVTPNIVYAYAHDDPHLLTSTPAGDVDPVSIFVNIDRQKREISNCVGNAVLSFIPGTVPTIAFTMLGNVATGTGGAAEAALATYQPGSAPAPVQNSSMTMAGSAVLIISSFVYDTGNVIDPRPDMDGEFGFAQPIITARQPIYTVTVESPPIADTDFEALYIANTEVDFSFTHNVGGGTRQVATITGSGIISEFPAQTELNGKLVYNLILRQSTKAGAGLFDISWA